ncbi:MAG TPA: hypothetical protein P5048_03820, partial [Chlamydiales bacterium]|nr:hypothetical protein [Chlamydiales bacterium]
GMQALASKVTSLSKEAIAAAIPVIMPWVVDNAGTIATTIGGAGCLATAAGAIHLIRLYIKETKEAALPESSEFDEIEDQEASVIVSLEKQEMDYQQEEEDLLIETAVLDTLRKIVNKVEKQVRYEDLLAVAISGDPIPAIPEEMDIPVAPEMDLPVSVVAMETPVAPEAPLHQLFLDLEASDAVKSEKASVEKSLFQQINKPQSVMKKVAFVVAAIAAVAFIAIGLALSSAMLSSVGSAMFLAGAIYLGARHFSLEGQKDRAIKSIYQAIEQHRASGLSDTVSLDAAFKKHVLDFYKKYQGRVTLNELFNGAVLLFLEKNEITDINKCFKIETNGTSEWVTVEELLQVRWKKFVSELDQSELSNLSIEALKYVSDKTLVTMFEERDPLYTIRNDFEHYYMTYCPQDANLDEEIKKFQEALFQSLQNALLKGSFSEENFLAGLLIVKEKMQIVNKALGLDESSVDAFVRKFANHYRLEKREFVKINIEHGQAVSLYNQSKEDLRIATSNLAILPQEILKESSLGISKDLLFGQSLDAFNVKMDEQIQGLKEAETKYNYQKGNLKERLSACEPVKVSFEEKRKKLSEDFEVARNEKFEILQASQVDIRSKKMSAAEESAAFNECQAKYESELLKIQNEYLDGLDRAVSQYKADIKKALYPDELVQESIEVLEALEVPAAPVSPEELDYYEKLSGFEEIIKSIQLELSDFEDASTVYAASSADAHSLIEILEGLKEKGLALRAQLDAVQVEHDQRKEEAEKLEGLMLKLCLNDPTLLSLYEEGISIGNIASAVAAS